MQRESNEICPSPYSTGESINRNLGEEGRKTVVPEFRRRRSINYRIVRAGGSSLKEDGQFGGGEGWTNRVRRGEARRERERIRVTRRHYPHGRDDGFVKVSSFKMWAR